MGMDARYATRAVAGLVVWISLVAACHAESVRSNNFLVTAADPQLAREVLKLAEQYRLQLANEWLGHELPPWSQPCPITVEVGGGAGGQTSFAFHRGTPFNWQMEVFGPRERILDSVLPHEILHTVFATHFGRPLPRWADEGACTTVEHQSEKDKNTTLLYRFLKSDRGIAFNRMFAMKEYPEDILPLYAQGYSLARYLIAQGGKQKFVHYVSEGMASNNWTRTTEKHYGHPTLSNLQIAWLDWVREGSNEAAIQSHGDIQLVSNETAVSNQAVVRGQSPSPKPNPMTLTGPLLPINPPSDSIAPSEPGVSGSFYTKAAESARQLVAPVQSDADPVSTTTTTAMPRSAPTYYLPGGTSLYR